MWDRAGKIKCREDIIEGLPNAFNVSIALLKGNTFGSCVNRIGQNAQITVQRCCWR
jgi:NADPH-dependent curcumin reductase CurA